MERKDRTSRKRTRKVLSGIPAAPGIAIGTAVLLDSEDFDILYRKVTKEGIAREIARFEDALIKTRSEILAIQDRIAREMGAEHAEIFNAHLLVLEDRMLIEEVITTVEREQLCIEYVFRKVLEKYIRVFANMNDEYLKERTADIEDVGKRILSNLLGKEKKTLKKFSENSIVVAYDLSPSDTASMHTKNVISFVTDIGGRTSHTAIIAKALEIAAVVGAESATANISHGDTLIVDGDIGKVYINPSKQAIEDYKKKLQKKHRFEKTLLKLRDLPAETLDGHAVELSANIEFPEEVPSLKAHGARGIGLYRTEYFYMNRKDLPTEEEQFLAYRKVAEEIKPFPIIIRTLDLGGDKFLSQLEIPKEMNPFLGWRAIRFCLARPDIFSMQLRAILRASVYGNIKMMFPMISGVHELRQGMAILRKTKVELRKKKVPFNEDMEVGVMIEVPSAAVTCDLLAKECNFFSIGTNDLIQYALAVDRVNEKVAYLYEPFHPGVLRFIRNIIEAAHNAGIWVGMCGEMAGEILYTLVLLGLGLDEFSTSPVNVPYVKHIIRCVSYAKAKEIAAHALSLSTTQEVESYIHSEMKKTGLDLL
ncbi:MAG: phosphoenolpyruvate--protein phosphotransferase [Candidatus Omnitrophica bacterium]|nr:phosphoenolpyruvate--protein phosphotransferase [Candidatus Omnitrophota bacterium]